MTVEISNSDDVIDSRDIIERIKELENAMEDAQFEAEGEKTIMEDGKEIFLDDNFPEEDYNELQALKALQDEAEGYAPDWIYGATLIRDSYFEEYAREFAEDVGLINRNMAWPCDCIDWEKAAEALQMDYTQVDFDGISYWVR